MKNLHLLGFTSRLSLTQIAIGAKKSSAFFFAPLRLCREKILIRPNYGRQRDNGKTGRGEQEFWRVHGGQGSQPDVRAGSVFGLLGPNGAGKTTTIRMIVNITAPDSGTISLFGRHIDSELAGPHRLPAGRARVLQENAGRRSVAILCRVEKRARQGQSRRRSTSGSHA